MAGMSTTTIPFADAALLERQRLYAASPAELRAHQLERLNRLLEAILPDNAFYRNKLGDGPLQLESLEQLSGLPFTFKSELMSPDHRHSLPVNLTWPADRYVRFHRTSGTLGRPMVVMDTASDWEWWIATWQYVLDQAGVVPGDRCLLAFSFGPFIGFWSAFDALVHRQCLAIPTGGMNTLSRLEVIQTSGANVLFCTPGYALHMAEVAHDNSIRLTDLGIRTIVVAGEPGGSIASTRERIENAWGARLVDHGGASEAGPWGMGDRAARGLHVIESEFIAEYLPVSTGGEVVEGELAELVLTSLGRTGAPVIRYRTGDLVRPRWNASPGETGFVLLEGGILGRTDDMLVIRGMNVFPSSVEQILRGFPEIIEFRLTAFRQSEMDQLKIEIEDRLHNPQRVAAELRVRLGLRVEVDCVPPGSLPRSEGKTKRFVDLRK